MQHFIRHPDPSAYDLGVLCLKAVAYDERAQARLREQAQQLLELQGYDREAQQNAGEVGRVA